MISQSSSKNIAIFGASGHIAKNLIFRFLSTKNRLYLFSGNFDKVQNFLLPLSYDNVELEHYENFNKKSFDVIINCIGKTNPDEISKNKNEFLSITEKYDNLILNYLKQNSNCQYLNFSSGIVYGNFSSPPNTKSSLRSSNTNDVYAISKLRSEKKHRSLSSLNIIDIRIFGFFSRFIDVTSHFFLSKIISCINNNEVFFTSKHNFYRDYIHPDDLFELINLCMNIRSNLSLDAYSTAPISKNQILDLFSNKYNLKFSFKTDLHNTYQEPFKEYYYSLSRTAAKIGYFPQYSSYQTILSEYEILNKLNSN